MEAKEFFHYKLDSCVYYREYLVLLLCVDDCLLFSTFRDKIDDL